MNQTTDIYVQKVTESKQTAAKYHNCNRLPIWKIIENQDDSGYLGDFVDQVHKESKISKSQPGYLDDLDDCVDQNQENCANSR